MELARLIDELSHPAAYSFPADPIEVHQTHISVVFLAGEFAFKIKKPVSLGFLDFSTLELRRHFCEEEVRLNRRLAPDVYLGVVPVVEMPDGLQVEGDGEPVEWAVKMRRLPAEATLESRLLRQEVKAAHLRTLAERLAAFHAAAEAGPHIASFGTFEVVAGNARENFEQSTNQVGRSVSAAVFQRLTDLTQKTLAELRPLIETRAREGKPRDTHGDLRLDHVYHFPEQPAPGDLVIVDCIEFNERFRYADPIADIAFLVMDFAFHGRRDLGREFAHAYFRAADPSGASEASAPATQGRELLAFYDAYRAVVRAKVEGLRAAESEVPASEREKSLASARAHWLLALGELESPGNRPCLLLVGGLPGTGKSTLAKALAQRAGFQVLRSDVIRKELAGLKPEQPGNTRDGEGIYTPEWNTRTYEECRRRAEEMLLEGQRVLIDANFREERMRQKFRALGRRLAVPALFLYCQADPETVKRRLQDRRSDASDADWVIYEQLARSWESVSPEEPRWAWAIPCGGTAEEAVAEALRVLTEMGLA